MRMISRNLCISISQTRLLTRTARPFSRSLRLFSTSDGQKHESAILALQEQLQQSGVEFTTNSYELFRHGKGESYHVSQPPEMVVAPRTVEEIQDIVRSCDKWKLPIVPFGTGTSLEGHVAALYGGVCIDMKHFQTTLGPDELLSEQSDMPDPIAVVGAGVTRKQLNEYLRDTGLYFVVDPGADASIGGMVATGASGTAAVLYGSMRENLLQLQVVLPDATIVHAGTKSLKNAAGYDLVSLFCGSEGTLGIITSATVKLHPIPEHVVAAVCVFDDLKQAAQAVAAIKLYGIAVSRCELLDATSVDAFNKYNPTRTPMQLKPTLFLEFEGSSEVALQEQVDMTQTICVNDYQGAHFQFASAEDERKALWSARHSLYYATLALREGASGAIVTDACVPLSKFADLIEATAKDVKELGVVGPCFGHAGDGNLHCILPVRENESEEYLSKLHRINDNLITRTLAAGGTCTGEHGIGYGKIPYLERQYGCDTVAAMRAIKKAFDPNNIMNPGKVVRF